MSAKTPEKTVVDFTEARAQKLEEKRRKTERIFFKQLLGIYCVTEQEELRSIDIVDVSEEGCSFQVPFDPTNPWPKDLQDIPVRLYFSQDTYITVRFRVLNSRPVVENGTRSIRYGCKADASLSSYEAYVQFVRFLKLYSEHAHQDDGKVTHFYI